MSRDRVSPLVERFPQRGGAVLSIAPGRGRQPTSPSRDHEQIHQEVQTLPHLGRRSMHGLVAFFLAKVLACQRMGRHQPKNDPSGLAGTGMDVPADDTHVAPR